MTTTRQIMNLVDAYGEECCKGNEYDNKYMEKSARDRVLVALKTYAPPPRKPWVGLTNEEIDKTHETQVWDARRSYARAIEAKLKEKNA